MFTLADIISKYNLVVEIPLSTGRSFKANAIIVNELKTELDKIKNEDLMFADTLNTKCGASSTEACEIYSMLFNPLRID